MDLGVLGCTGELHCWVPWEQGLGGHWGWTWRCWGHWGALWLDLGVLGAGLGYWAHWKQGFGCWE